MRFSTLTPFLFATSIVASPIVNAVVDTVVMTAVVNEFVTVHEGPNQPAATITSSVIVNVDAVQAQTPANTATPAVPVASQTTSGLPLTYQPNLDTESATYQGLVLLNHNVHRANHSVPDLVYNSTLASYAQQIAKTCVYDHSK